MAIEVTVADVGAQLRHRTQTPSSREAGTFNADTRPTGDQVQLIINDAVGEVEGRIGTDDPCTDYLDKKANNMAKLYAAMQVELTFFAHEVRSGQSPYKELKELYDEGMKALIEGVSENCGGGGGESVGGEGMPSYSYNDETGRIGWSTAW